jgi:endonuclease YncB( thermonuclease family)
MSVKIFWDPTGTSVDTLGTDKFLRVTDGDTPYISTSIRLLSIDTPEIHYPGLTKPSKHDVSFAKLATWIDEEKAPIQQDLGQYLIPKLETGNAGTLQEQQGIEATSFFRDLLEKKLALDDDKKRPLFIRAADEHFDQYGRLLAYISPNYTAKERESMSRRDRATFNLLMVESGWAASFPIYPSIPSHPDLVLLREAAKDAFENGKGAWANSLTLTGYEFRMCVRLYDITEKLVSGKELYGSKKYEWIERYCVDMTTTEINYPQSYHRVKPYDRIFVWPKDVVEAVAKMNLVPAS